MTELALTRIFSVVMYYHFAFLAISIALFGLSASGVFAYRRADGISTRMQPDRSSATRSLVYAACTIVALFVLVRLRVGLNYSPREPRAHADDLHARGAAVLHRRPRGHARDLPVVLAHQRGVCRRLARGGRAAASCCIPLLDRVGAPGVVVAAAALAVAAAVLFAPPRARARVDRQSACAILARPARGPAGQASPASTSRTPKATRPIECSSASGIRSRASASTSAPTVTGRSARPTRDRCRKRDSWTSTRRRPRRSSASRPTCPMPSTCATS